VILASFYSGFDSLDIRGAGNIHARTSMGKDERLNGIHRRRQFGVVAIAFEVASNRTAVAIIHEGDRDVEARRVIVIGIVIGMAL
jgi:hypothetical protein